MTIINASIFESGTLTPLPGYISVRTIAPLSTTPTLYVQVPVKFPLVAGLVSMDLVPSDVARVSYRFEIYMTGLLITDPDTLIDSFEAVVPFSAAPISLSTLGTQSGLKYDARDASLLTLARYLTANDSFLGFLGDYLWKNRGAYDALTVYKRGDVVLYSGSSYQYISNTQAAGYTPGVNPLIWTLLVSGSGGGGSSVPVGGMFLYPTSSVLPLLHLRCNGAAVSRSVYSVLFGVIGTFFGAGDGTTTFNLPDSPITGASSFIVNAGI